jgi:hypothetical protein
MKFLSLTICCLLMALCLECACLAEEWRGITPLRSARADVEKALNVKSEGKSFDFFDLGEEWVMVFYSEGPCSGNLEKWNVPTGRVLAIVVTPKPAYPKYLSALKVDPSRFKRSSSSTDYSAIITTYTDEVGGLVIEEVGEHIGALIYRPSAKDRHLLCRATPRSQ